MSNIPTLQSNKKKYGELLENNETVFNSVDGILSKVKGDSHASASGGERIELQNGDRIYSSKIKLPREAVAAILDKKPTFVKKMSPAELSEKYPTAQYDEVLNNPDADKRAKTTATLMKAKNMAKLEAIFNAQETFKEVKGVKDGILLKDQGLNSDLEPTGEAAQTPIQVEQPIQEQSNIPQEIASQVGGVNFQIESPQRNLFENLQFNGVKQVDRIQGVNQFSYHPKQEVNQVGKVVPQVNQPYTEYNPNDLLVPELPQVEDIPIPVTEPILEEIVAPIKNKFANLQFRGYQPKAPEWVSQHPMVSQVGAHVNTQTKQDEFSDFRNIPTPEPIVEPTIEVVPDPIQIVQPEIITTVNKFAKLQFKGHNPKVPQGVSEFNYQPVYQSQPNQVGTTVKSIFDNLQNIPIPPEEIDIQPVRNKFEGLKYRGYEPKLPDGDSAFNYEPKNQVAGKVGSTGYMERLDPFKDNKTALPYGYYRYDTGDGKEKIYPMAAKGKTLNLDVIGNLIYETNPNYISKPGVYPLFDQKIIENQYDKLGMTVPKIDSYTPSTTQTQESDAYLSDHDFVKTGLYKISASYDNKNKKWHNGTDISIIEKFKKEHPGWDDNKITSTIKDYQEKSIGLNPDGTYKQGLDERGVPWSERRKEVFLHNTEGEPWNHQQYEEVKDDKGNVVDYKFTNYNDGDNKRKQILFKPRVRTSRIAWDTPELPSTRNPNIQVPLPERAAPAITKEMLPNEGKPATPLDTIELQVPKELQKAKMSTYLDLFNRQKAVPYLKNDNQTVAYQRTIPMNTLAQERGQNFMNNMYNNSDASSQLSQSIGADGYAKTLEGIDNVQLKNYQSMLNTDNQNNQLYMNAFNANELAKNNNMAEYVGRTQQVEDQASKEEDILKDNLRNYNLQIAMGSDDLAKRRLTGMLTNEKFLPKQYGRYTYGADQNQNFSRLDQDAANHPFFIQQNKQMEQILNNPNATEKEKIEMMKILMGKK